MHCRRLAIASLFVVATLATGSIAFAAGDPLSYCKSDVQRLCPGVEPGGGRIIACLKQHQMEVSVGCAKAIQKMKAQMGK